MLIRFEIQMQLAIIIITVLICLVSQEFMDRIFYQKRMAKYAHDLNNWPAQFEVVLNNGYEAIGCDGYMYLYPDCIFRFTPEGFDTEMLLDPFEKQFDLPPIAVEKGNFIPFEVEVVGVVGEGSSKVGGIEYDAPERNRIVPTISLACEPNRLVPQDIFSSFKHIFTFGDLIFRMGFLPYDEESSSLLDCEESGEIKISPVKHIGCLPFVFQPVHGPGIMHICMADPVENWNLCGNINLGMNLDAGLCASELGPFKDRHAQIDGSRIDRIEPSVKFELFGSPFGISPLEAMQCEVPTIISKQSGCAEILEKCIKTDYWDIHAMADAIYAICNYPSLYEYLKIEGKKEVDAITWDKVGERVLKRYKKVLGIK
jgi:hypothetical protein